MTRGPLPVNRETDITENITFPQTMYEGGNENKHTCARVFSCVAKQRACVTDLVR